MFENPRQDDLSIRRVFASCLGKLWSLFHKTERIPRFVRGLTFSIRSTVFRASRGGFFPVHWDYRQRGGIEGERRLWGP